MLAERLNQAWAARCGSSPIDVVMRFAEEGLVLGAGTVLAKRSTENDADISIDSNDLRLRALLTAAHLRYPRPESIAHLRKAAQRWNEGQEALAAMHLVLSRLDRLERSEADAHRLFLAERLLSAGVEASAIVEAIDAGDQTFDRLQKKFNPDQPRVPAGSGQTSGQWTSMDGTSSASLSPDDVAHAIKPPVGTIDACEEARDDCIAAAMRASANDNLRVGPSSPRQIDINNCKSAGWICDQMSWIIEDIWGINHGAVIFPHRGTVIIDKGQLDRYFPPLPWGRPAPIRRTLIHAPANGSAQLSSDDDRVAYRCPPWSKGAEETDSLDHSGFSACRKAIGMLSTKLNGRVSQAACSTSNEWGRIVRAKVGYEHEGVLGEALVTCWCVRGRRINIALKLDCC